ncbi:MAG: crossover junction endodeoxyribonuclease RuvC [Oscillospiraceae bacterium]|nr:crossover junction endodeoxyribonuclease RuvC [Oscillospiraceae bacterium]
MIILGIDPGLATVGYGVLKYEKHKFTTIDYNAVITPPHIPVHDRLIMIYDDLQKIIDLHKPDDLAIEELFYNTNQKTVIAVCEARGVILLCARQNGLNISEYTPLQVKQAVVGYGRAEKIQVQSMVKNILNLEKIPRPDDAADAVALAICHAHSKPTNSLFSALKAK